MRRRSRLNADRRPGSAASFRGLRAVLTYEGALMTIGAEQQKATPEILARPPKSSSGSAIMKTAQPRLKRPRLRIRDKLLLALLPTATVLPMLGLIDAFGGLHLMCASMASSAFLIYADPRNEMNSVHAVIVSQM